MWNYLILLIFCIQAHTFELQLPRIYTDQNISGWLMSEKLDGIRGYWDGKVLRTKQGYRIYAPQYFTKQFPPFALDGELWIGRGAFEAVQSVVLDDEPSHAWKKVTYNIFEVPGAKGGFLNRLKKAENWFHEHPSQYVRIVRQYPCHDRKALESFLSDVMKKHGEGVILKEPRALYHTGRSAKILKVKSYYDAEGKVVAIHPGKGKYKNMMGSLTIEMENGKRFRLGNGFKREERIKPPKIGQYVTYKYYGLTKNGLPKFAAFLHIREAKTFLKR